MMADAQTMLMIIGRDWLRCYNLLFIPRGNFKLYAMKNSLFLSFDTQTERSVKLWWLYFLMRSWPRLYVFKSLSVCLSAWTKQNIFAYTRIFPASSLVHTKTSKNSETDGTCFSNEARFLTNFNEYENLKKVMTRLIFEKNAKESATNLWLSIYLNPASMKFEPFQLIYSWRSHGSYFPL